MPRKHRILSLVLLALILSQTACGAEQQGTADTDAQTSADDTGTTDETTTVGFEYPDVNYDGAEFRILNFDQLWNMYIHLDSPEINGEVLNDAVYTRNRKVEQKLGCKIVEKTFENDTANTLSRITDHAKTSIMSGEDEYDVMMLPVSEAPDLITGGYLQDLKSMPEFKFDGEWWDQEIIGATTFDNRLYFASGAANLMAFDSMWCLFFNENMAENHQLDMPYDLVREGKWTIDEATKYAKAVANLNGDESWKWSKDGKCVYGISSHQNSPEHFWFSAGEFTLDVDKKGEPKFILGSDRFYGVMDKLAVLLDGKEGTTLKANNTDFDADNGGYVYVFTTGRSFFMTGEIKAAQLMRDMTDTFGIVPFPKYDESQPQYYTSLVSQLFYMTIPSTNMNTSRTATIYEALTHESYLSVIPTYYSNVVEQKGLRNEDSIDMLEIMRQTRAVDVATIFNWSSNLRSTLNTKLFNGNSQVASDIAAQQTKVEASMQKFFDFLAEQNG